MKICRQCGKEFLHKKPGQWYCSEQCKKVAHRRMEKESREKTLCGGKYLAVLERDGYQCTACQVSDFLCVHHIDKSGNAEVPNNEMSNLATLCKSCHSKLHRAQKDNGIIRNPEGEVACPVCGRWFYLPDCRRADGKQHCCSKACCDKQKELPPGERERRYKEKDQARNKDPKRQEYKRLKKRERDKAKREGTFVFNPGERMKDVLEKTQGLDG